MAVKMNSLPDSTQSITIKIPSRPEKGSLNYDLTKTLLIEKSNKLGENWSSIKCQK